MKISLEQFKQQVLSDYKLALVASQETGYDLAQVALSKYITEDDAYIALCQDKAYEIRLKQKPQGTTIKSAIECAMRVRNDVGKLVVCTTARHIFDAIFDAAASQLPIAFVVWNVKDSNGFQLPNSDILKLFGGFSTFFRSNLSIQAVKGNDYSALCMTFEQQLSFTRTKHLPSVTIVESNDNCTESFAQWITEHELFSAKELLSVSQQCQE